MLLIAKLVTTPGEEEVIYPGVAAVNVEKTELGPLVMLTFGNSNTLALGPTPPHQFNMHQVPTVYITNDRGNTIATYYLYPGSQEAWDEQAAIALTGTDPLFDEFGNILSVEELHHLRTKMAQKPDLDGYPSPHREDKPYTLDTTSVTADRIPGVSTNTISTTIERPRAPSGHPLT